MQDVEFYVDLKSIDQFDEFVKNSKVCVIDFGADWCGPCKRVGKELSSKFKSNEILSSNIHTNDDNSTNNLTFVKVNVDNFGELYAKYSSGKTKGIPFFIFFKNGVLQDTYVVGGSRDKIDEIVETITELLK